MGIAWALQGAWILPATFMRGPEWIAIGGALAAAGFVLIFFSMRTKAPEPAPPKPSP